MKIMELVETKLVQVVIVSWCNADANPRGRNLDRHYFSNNLVTSPTDAMCYSA